VIRTVGHLGKAALTHRFFKVGNVVSENEDASLADAGGIFVTIRQTSNSGVISKGGYSFIYIIVFLFNT